MKEKKRKLSWFQKLILGYLVFIGFLKGLIQDGNIFGGIIIGFGSLFIVHLLMWLYNKYIAP